jgi:pyridoxamine 5'-phosphate oxidase-like protein
MVYDEITAELAGWIKQQHVFFVATAPSSATGLVNCSPKGMDTFRILGPRDVAYLDLTGSGIETIAHLRDNRRIVFMFCAFNGPPKVVRLHGFGRVIEPGSPQYDEVAAQFPAYPGARAIVRAELIRIGDSCGYSLPRFEYVDDRDTLVRWAQAKGGPGLDQYRRQKNRHSLECLPGLENE